jgi:hypothetical protein
LDHVRVVLLVDGFALLRGEGSQRL